MSRVAKSLQRTQEERKQLEKISRGRTVEKRLAERAEIILRCLEIKSNKEIAKELHLNEHTVGKWRNSFSEKGIEGLYDKKRSGRPPICNTKTRDTVLKRLEQPPPKGQATWDGKGLAKALEIPDYMIWRILRKEGIQLQRFRTWCISKDKNFASKAADVISLYLNPPPNAFVLALDEKPNIQALTRLKGYAKTSSGKIVNGLQNTYRRNGTTNLFAALEVATGRVKTKMTKHKKRVDFLSFLEFAIVDIPHDIDVHIIVDNYCTHKNNDEWLAKRKNVYLHFTPTSASWLNLIEIWFGILSRKALRGASFESISQLEEKIQEFIDVYQETAKPFKWSKPEVRGAQLSNNVTNFCN